MSDHIPDANKMVRCEPPEHLAKADGWHWVDRRICLITGARLGVCAMFWVSGKKSWRHDNGYFFNSADWRYLSPIPSHDDLARLVEAAQMVAALAPLLRLITVRQVIKAGDNCIRAVGLNPWAMNEGLATGDEPAVDGWKLDALTAALALFTPKEPKA